MMRLGIGAALVLVASGAYGADKDCDHSRECLGGVLNTYLQALTKHNPASLPTTRSSDSSGGTTSLTFARDGISAACSSLRAASWAPTR